MTFDELEKENAQLRTALTDCNRGLNSWAAKVAPACNLLGFQLDESKEAIAEKVKAFRVEEARVAQELSNARVALTTLELLHAAALAKLGSATLALIRSTPSESTLQEPGTLSLGVQFTHAQRGFGRIAVKLADNPTTDELLHAWELLARAIANPEAETSRTAWDDTQLCGNEIDSRKERA